MLGIITNFKKYSFLMNQMISRDFKVKYKRSVLGVFWSLLYPLLMMAVMAVVFSNVFKFSTPGVSYLSYLLIGLTYFNYFSEASNLAMSSVVANFSLINKVYLVLIFTGTGINWYHLILPFSFICLFMFTLGMGLILSTVAVFFRDMFYVYGIIITIWTYLTPIMYDISNISNTVLQSIMKLNPMYQIINFARTIILYNTLPTLTQFIGCFLSGALALLIGIFLFKKNQDKFIYYV